MIERFGFDHESQIIEIASNDGYLLQYFKEKKIPVLGIEPAENVAQAAKEADPLSIRAFDGMDHGTDLLAAHPGLDMTIITGWLYNHLPPKN